MRSHPDNNSGFFSAAESTVVEGCLLVVLYGFQTPFLADKGSHCVLCPTDDL